ncbi:MAG: flagellar basal body L-ring protein FlgH [Planctomycetes bacterium]|nr:flagellar basal body L-ring protein FlgH [Planctomycetota bacterium]
MAARRITVVAVALFAQWLPAGVASAQAPANSGNSLWLRGEAGAARSTLADHVAAQVGDIVTVIVSEGQTVQDDGKMEVSKESGLDSALEIFDLKPETFNTLPALKYSSARAVEGETKYSQKGKFETRLTAVVQDVKPNGTLLIEGRRAVHIDGDLKEMRVRGFVRPIDIAGDNTISSDRIANAEVRYDAEGSRSEAVEKNWFERALDFLWPF